MNKITKAVQLLREGPTPHRYRMYRLQLPNYVDSPLDGKHGIEFRRLTQNDLPCVAAMRSHSVEEAFRKMMAQGVWCYVAFDGEKLVGHAACFFPPMKVASFSLKKHPVIRYCHVSEAYRGHHIFPLLLKKIIADIKKTDYQELYIGTDWDNLASQHSFSTAGFSFAYEHTSYTWYRFVWKRIQL